MSDLINQYRRDLKNLRKQLNPIQSKRYKIIENGKEKTIDDRTDEEKIQASLLSQMISSTEYALFWLENGYPKPAELKKVNKKRKTQLWGSIDDLVQQKISKSDLLHLWVNDNKKENEIMPIKKSEHIQQVKEILAILSKQEREYFLLKHQAMMSNKECAEKMGIKEGTVKSMSQRIRTKIENYFIQPTQTALFYFEE